MNTCASTRRSRRSTALPCAIAGADDAPAAASGDMAASRPIAVAASPRVRTYGASDPVSPSQRLKERYVFFIYASSSLCYLPTRCVRLSLPAAYPHRHPPAVVLASAPAYATALSTVAAPKLPPRQPTLSSDDDGGDLVQKGGIPVSLETLGRSSKVIKRAARRPSNFSGCPGSTASYSFLAERIRCYGCTSPDPLRTVSTTARCTRRARRHCRPATGRRDAARVPCRVSMSCVARLLRW